MIVDVYQYFKKHPKYNKLVGDDYLFVEYKCPINVEEYQLWSDSHLITYVINGRKDWTSGQRTFKIESGDALFVRKGVYSTRQYFEVDYCVILFFINDEFIRKFIQDNQLQLKEAATKEHAQIFEIDVDDSLDSLIHSVFNYIKTGGHIPQNLVELKFKELLFNIFLNPKNNELISYFKSVTLSSKTDLKNIMQTNFQYDLSISDFARLCDRSLSTFKRDFQTQFNDTPGNWIKEKRLEFAKSLLINSDLSINEICYESGFKNTSHFNKIFKEKFGSPPHKFKKLTLK